MPEKKLKFVKNAQNGSSAPRNPDDVLDFVMSVKMAIKEGFSETRHSTSYGELKKSNEVTSFEAILRRNRFSNAFSGL
ncbi:hypothetical protein [Saccharicrinis fermentans]|uniref:Uncharacterized protein n=1 Tax=Saccharicrinis fermentans DSM 9555 = JCM 21142 TaxID=869213 RepID=W7Y512_9BACT|nr:hypothetical protein [Saccharicrinis fermentans]GAF06030.1 hypothetical protein JCM21142_134798 [Saccharicrinis fermentans DSM 9555 = JCM 21142]